MRACTKEETSIQLECVKETDTIKNKNCRGKTRSNRCSLRREKEGLYKKVKSSYPETYHKNNENRGKIFAIDIYRQRTMQTLPGPNC